MLIVINNGLEIEHGELLKKYNLIFLTFVIDFHCLFDINCNKFNIPDAAKEFQNPHGIFTKLLKSYICFLFNNMTQKKL